MTLTGIWNQLAILGFPAVALALLTLTGGNGAALQTIATIGLVAFLAVAAAFAAALSSSKMARRVGDLAARLANRALRIVRRGPVEWNGESFVRFPQLGDRPAAQALARPDPCDAGRPADGLPRAAREPASPGGRSGRGERDRGVRRLVARAGAWLDPDHARRARRRRARPDDGARRLRRQQRGVVAAVLVYRFLTIVPDARARGRGRARPGAGSAGPCRSASPSRGPAGRPWTLAGDQRGRSVFRPAKTPSRAGAAARRRPTPARAAGRRRR